MYTGLDKNDKVTVGPEDKLFYLHLLQKYLICSSMSA